MIRSCVWLPFWSDHVFDYLSVCLSFFLYLFFYICTSSFLLSFPIRFLLYLLYYFIINNIKVPQLIIHSTVWYGSFYYLSIFFQFVLRTSIYMYLHNFFIYLALLCFQFWWNRYTPLHLLANSLVGLVEVIEKLSNLILRTHRM